MRSAGAYLLSAIVAAGILSAGVSVAAVRWLAPGPVTTAGASADTAAAPTTTPAAPALQAPAQAQAAPPAGLPSPPIPGQEEQTALEFLRRAGSGDTMGALTLSTGLTEEALRHQVGRYAAVPRRATRLPGVSGPVSILMWADYRWEGLPAKGQYVVTMHGGKVASLKGPLSPEKGFQPFTAPLVDEQGNPVHLVNYAGRGLVLVTPRTPEPGLGELLAGLHAAYASRGVEVVLATDIRSPDWVAAARQAGFKGQVWRVKLRMEDVPLVSRSSLLGAYGVLVDRSGFAVGSLGALDPLTYNLTDQSVTAIAPAVFQAYGLLP